MRRSLAQQQLAEEMLGTTHLGLLSDETSKYGKKFEGFHVVDEKGRTYVLSLRSTASKSGQDILNTFQQILTYIDDTAMNIETDVGKKILTKISSTMSSNKIQ